MDKLNKLKEIFENDPLGLLNIKPVSSPIKNESERLKDQFQEINHFFITNNREPQQGGNIQEHQLYSRLKAIRESQSKTELLKSFDIYGLLVKEQKQMSSLDDVLNDDILGLLNDDDEGLFDLIHIAREEGPERAEADFIARRKRCADFEEYEPLFKEVQKDLANKRRILLESKERNLKEGCFYVHNGVLLLLEKVDIETGMQQFRSGSRLRRDGRTRVIFENGTESNMLYRSLYKALLDNGKAVSENISKVNENFIETFNSITEEDKESGYIYVLKSKSDKPEIKSIRHLYKIGFSKDQVEDRIKNAKDEPTYLMDEVSIVMTYKCYNMNPQKLELLMHNFFGSSCLNVEVFDKKGHRHIPREWFIAPLDIIDQAVHMIISGEIVKYRYDADREEIINTSL